MNATFKVVIPARYASTRLPGKPLALIAGRPMVEHVHRQCLASGAEQVVIATDHAEVEAGARKFAAEVAMTREDHASGTDRLAEVVEQYGWADDTIVVNVQGDEPLMPPALIRQVAGLLQTHPDAGIATLCTPILEAAEFFDPHVVKVVRDRAGYALYFSRAPIPWDRDEFATGSERLPRGVPHCRHIGLYGYRAGFLRAWRHMEPAPIEGSEMLEQLRALWHGVRIQVATAEEPPGPGVDTPQDLERIEALLSATAT